MTWLSLSSSCTAGNSFQWLDHIDEWSSPWNWKAYGIFFNIEFSIYVLLAQWVICTQGTMMHCRSPWWCYSQIHDSIALWFRTTYGCMLRMISPSPFLVLCPQLSQRQLAWPCFSKTGSWGWHLNSLEEVNGWKIFFPNGAWQPNS